MVNPASDHLDQEVHVFCRYLVAASPDDYVVSRYRKAHALGFIEAGQASNPFERLVVGIARSSPWLTRLADAHTSVFGGDLLRKKLVLTVGILENSPQQHPLIDAMACKSRAAFLAMAATLAVAHVLTVIAGMMLFFPLRFLCLFLSKDSTV